MKKWISAALFTCMLALAGCDGVKGCQVYDYYSFDGVIEVTALDASTSAPVPNTTMTLTIAPGDTSVLTVGSDVSKYPVDFTGLNIGKFPLSIAAPGYATWNGKVAVNCAQPPATVTARLKKSP